MKESKIENKASVKKSLGIKTRVIAEARVRAGCSKSITRTCGMNYRGG